MRLFPANGPLEFVAIDILGPLLRTARGNKFLLVISDRYTKLTRTVPMTRITASAVAKAFAVHWAFTYGPPALLVSDNGKQFASRVFVHLCRILGADNTFTTTYHPQANGQVERFNRTLLAALRHYVLEHPREWDEFTPALTYAYNTQIHRITGFAPFELVLSRPPPHLSLKARPDLSAVSNRATLYKRWVARLKQLLETASRNSASAQARYKRDFDARLRRNAESLVPGVHVFVRRDYSPKTDGSVPGRHKLSPVADGPFKVLSVDEDTVVVDDGDGNEERLSRDRVVRAPSTADHVNAALTEPRASLTAALRAAGPPPAHIVRRTLSDAPTPIRTLPPREVLEAIEQDLVLPRNSLRCAMLGSSATAEDRAAISAPVPPDRPSLTSDEVAEVASRAGVSPDALGRALQPPSRDALPASPDPSPPAALTDIVQSPLPSDEDAVDLGPLNPDAAAQDTDDDRETPERTTSVRRSHRLAASHPPPAAQAVPGASASAAAASDSDATLSRRPQRKDLYVLDKLLDHNVVDGELKLLCRWHDCPPSEDSWEPLRNLRRSQVVRYYRQRRLPLPPGMHQCLDS